MCPSRPVFNAQACGGSDTVRVYLRWSGLIAATSGDPRIRRNEENQKGQLTLSFLDGTGIFKDDNARFHQVQTAPSGSGSMRLFSHMDWQPTRPDLNPAENPRDVKGRTFHFSSTLTS